MWKKLKFQVNKIIIKINLLWTCLLLWVWTQMVWATSEYRGQRKHPRKSMSVPTGRRQSLPKPFVSGKKNQSLCTHLLKELHMKELNELNMRFVVELATTALTRSTEKRNYTTIRSEFKILSTCFEYYLCTCNVLYFFYTNSRSACLIKILFSCLTSFQLLLQFMTY